MKRVTLTVTAVLLAVPAFAFAKTGVGFQTDPANVDTNSKQKFTVVLLHEPRGPNGQAKPYAGDGRPLVTFRSRSGRVIRVRASHLLSGLATGTVAFPDKGPWKATISYRGHTVHGDQEQDPGFYAGTDVGRDSSVTEVMRPPAQAAPPQPGGGFTWWPFLFALPAIAGAAWLLRRRRSGPGGQLGEIAGGGA